MHNLIPLLTAAILPLIGMFGHGVEVDTVAAADLITNSIGMKLKLIPAGEFMMGSPANEANRNEDEGPQHKVGITKAFYMGVTEVTQGQWFAVMGTKPWAGREFVQEGDREFVREGDTYPAMYVSWDDAVVYCEKLSAREGKTYRLPTEAEWEYACRGGTSTDYSFGSGSGSLKDYAWFDENAYGIGESHAHTVGMKKSNPFGLYDMHGNVFEWCADIYDAKSYSSRSGTTMDPMSSAGSGYRVLRGGSWYFNSGDSRSANRSRNRPGSRSLNVGFRVVR